MVTIPQSGKVLHADLKDLVIEVESGARKPRKRWIKNLLIAIALTWAFFQLWIASPLSFSFVSWFNSFDIEGLELSVLNEAQTRSIHLAFAVAFAFLAYPAFKRSPRRYIPLIDWAFALIGAFCAAYLFLFHDALATRPGLPTDMDKWVACIGLLLLLEATRRSLGPPLMLIASIFLLYTYFGNSDFIPDMLRHKGQSLNKISSHQWLSTEGVFGIAIGVSSSFVFLFVLFGALLDKAGAGNYFIKVAFALLGHTKGGPAKAAVLSSAMTGLVSGSSIANVVTTGTFTIPLMRRVGFSGQKAGAIEVSSSVNGQIMPPVMGAAAFIIAEYVGISYTAVVKHAFLPAVISYIALLYIVHLEAVKANMQVLPRRDHRPLLVRMWVAAVVICSVVIISGVAYVLLGEKSCMLTSETFEGICLYGLKHWLKDYTIYAVLLILAAIYIAALKLASYYPDALKDDDANAPITELPKLKDTTLAGLHFLLPIIVLVWCLMVERRTAGLAAFWATITMMVIISTQRLVKAWLASDRSTAYLAHIKNGLWDLFEGMIAGSRNMIAVAIATAAAGIIVGVVSLTGVGNVLTDVIQSVAGNSIILTLLFTALICLVLGMGLPTTANYIVVASVMVFVVQQLAAANGLVIPVIAVHLFVFYFGIMADVTPPVGLASFAAAAISGADPIKTGIQSFSYSLRTAILPFFFVFNHELIMIGVDGFWHMLWVLFYATVAILLFSAAMQGYFITRCKIHETIILLITSVVIFVPSSLNNLVFPTHTEFTRSLATDDTTLIEGKRLILHTIGEDFDGEVQSFRYFLSIGADKTVRAALHDYGIIFVKEGFNYVVDDVLFNSAADQARIDFTHRITHIEVPLEQPDARYMYIVALSLLGFVVLSQTSRRKRSLGLSSLSSIN